MRTFYYADAVSVHWYYEVTLEEFLEHKPHLPQTQKLNLQKCREDYVYCRWIRSNAYENNEPRYRHLHGKIIDERYVWIRKEEALRYLIYIQDSI